MIHKEIVEEELYVYLNGRLLYKRWLRRSCGIIFCQSSFIPKFNKNEE